MDNVHDRARQLAEALKSSQYYRRYEKAKEKIKNDDESLEMVSQFHEKHLELQQHQMSGGQITEEQREELTRMRQILDLKPEVREYLQAQTQLVQMIADIQEILNDAVDMGLPQSDADDESEQPE